MGAASPLVLIEFSGNFLKRGHARFIKNQIPAGIFHSQELVFAGSKPMVGQQFVCDILSFGNKIHNGLNIIGTVIEPWNNRGSYKNGQLREGVDHPCNIFQNDLVADAGAFPVPVVIHMFDVTDDLI